VYETRRLKEMVRNLQNKFEHAIEHPETLNCIEKHLVAIAYPEIKETTPKTVVNILDDDGEDLLAVRGNKGNSGRSR
jgi:HEPN domain-containing protein